MNFVCKTQSNLTMVYYDCENMVVYCHLLVLPRYYEGIMSGKRIKTSKHGPVGPAENIVRKSVANLKRISTKQAPYLTDKLDRKRRIAAAYYRSKRRGFNGGDKIKDWLEIEIDGEPQLGKF